MKITVTQLDDGRIVIASADGTDHPPCIYTVNIIKLVDGKDEIDSPHIWTVNRDLGLDDDKCKNKIIYPEIPAHYHGESDEPLVPGHRYVIDIYGASYGAGTTIVRRGHR
ncbi:MAG: hypothetical protein P0Y59_15070 [Candidatus Sphingomonas phytovorans]|nr:hypothetical protein [Sphingomonas sp.]WEJ98264.1 MAG: hypothetical protein P0Y59_15070 [Sphingomonas sp.]